MAARKRALSRPARNVSPERVEQVLKWMIAGNRDADITAAIMSEWPGQDPDTALKAATDKLILTSQIPRDAAIGWCYEATQEIYRKAAEIGDLAAALRAIKLLSELAEKYGTESPKGA